MPSREILRHSISKFEKLRLKRIAPQHGSVIPKDLIKPVTDKLKNLECGIFLMARDATNIYRLSDLNRLLKNSLKILTIKRDFREIKNAIYRNIRKLLPIKIMDFYIRDMDGGVSKLVEEQETDTPEISVQNILLNMSMIGLSREEWQDLYGEHYFLLHGDVLLIPLFSTETGKIISLALLGLTETITVNEELEDVIEQIILPLSVAVEREIILRNVKMDKKKFYEQAIRDRLTGLYTRLYMEEAVNRLIRIHDRNKDASFAVIMFDLDHFKRVNDSYGHAAGDKVLQSVAKVILDCTREEDINVRYGGEEFASFIVSCDYEKAVSIAERVRKGVEKMSILSEGYKLNITISGGVAFRKQRESLDSVIERADKALYKAKHNGRNCIETTRYGG